MRNSPIFCVCHPIDICIPHQSDTFICRPLNLIFFPNIFSSLILKKNHHQNLLFFPTIFLHLLNHSVFSLFKLNVFSQQINKNCINPQNLFFLILSNISLSAVKNLLQLCAPAIHSPTP